MDSIWTLSTKSYKKNYEELNKSIEVDVCIVGGGITGVSTAYMLAKNELKVCILEKDSIGKHTTGFTTGKITSQHGLFYKYLTDTFSTNFAKKYLDANQNAISNIRDIINTENIDCDFEQQDNYIYTNDESEVSKIKDEVTAVNNLGFNAEFSTSIPFPIDSLASIKFPNQAQFNSLKYIYGLCDCITKNNGLIFENTKVYDIKHNLNSYTTYTKDYSVKSKYVVLSTGYPIINVDGFYFLKMYQERSYIIAVDTHTDLPNGMCINTKTPITSLRTALYNNKRVLLVGGYDHKVGEKLDNSNAYDCLMDTCKSIFPNSELIAKWNTQDCVSLDKIPYIGEFSLTSPNMFVATGYKKWGMTSSNVAANIISDKILGIENEYSDIFKSTRFHPIKNGTEFTNMVKQTVSSLIVDKFKIPKDTIDSIPTNDAKKIEIGDIKLGIYKDNNGKLYALRPICSHLGCELNWNTQDKTWDCPCHGSRFSYDGTSLYAPSIKSLPLIDI